MKYFFLCNQADRELFVKIIVYRTLKKTYGDIQLFDIESTLFKSLLKRWFYLACSTLICMLYKPSKHYLSEHNGNNKKP